MESDRHIRPRRRSRACGFCLRRAAGKTMNERRSERAGDMAGGSDGRGSAVRWKNHRLIRPTDEGSS